MEFPAGVRVETEESWSGPPVEADLEDIQKALDRSRASARRRLTRVRREKPFTLPRWDHPPAVWCTVTAVRAGDSDGNPATAGDPTWTPLVSAAQDPAYPGAHAVISTAAADVLATLFRSDAFTFSAQSSALPGVERSFSSFSAAANEATLSRIYAGQHFRTDEVAGQRLGDQIARHALQRLLLPERPSSHVYTYATRR